jgi:hypothetical protein
MSNTRKKAEPNYPKTGLKPVSKNGRRYSKGGKLCK